MALQNNHNVTQAIDSPFLYPSHDTAPDDHVEADYYSFLQDSLNPQLPDTVFRFELRKIVLPETASSDKSEAVYNMPSLVTSQTEKPRKLLPQVRQITGFDWLTFILLIGVAVLAWIRFFHTKRLKQLFKAVYARHNVNQLLRDGSLTNEGITFGLILIFLISVSTLIIKFAGANLSDALGINNMLLIFLITIVTVGIFWLIKLLIIKLLGGIFKTKQASEEYLLSNIMFNTIAGLVAFPVLIAWNYTGLNVLLYSILFIIAATMLLRMIRNISLGIGMQSFSVVYLFLYLCTLEILPFLVAYKFYTMLGW